VCLSLNCVLQKAFGRAHTSAHPPQHTHIQAHLLQLSVELISGLQLMSQHRQFVCRGPPKLDELLLSHGVLHSRCDTVCGCGGGEGAEHVGGSVCWL